jgi:hypothetical protein
MIAIPSSCLRFRGWSNCNTFIMQTCWFNKKIVGAKVVLHKSDHGKVPLNHAMEDVNWVHERSRWICKFNGCIDSYRAKWLFHQHLDNKHSHHMEACKSTILLLVLGDEGNKTTMPWMLGFWTTHMHDKHKMKRR